MSRRPPNPWDPEAWRTKSPKKVERDGGEPSLAETVRAPTDDEIRVLQAEVPEAAGKPIFVLEREGGAPPPLPSLPADAAIDVAEISLINTGWASDRIFAREIYPKGYDRVRPQFSLVLYAKVKLSAKTSYRFKKETLWQSVLDGGLVVLHPAEALAGTKAFGSLLRQLRPDPGFSPEFSPDLLTYTGDPARPPPITMPVQPSPAELLVGYAPRRMQTVGEDSEANKELVGRFPSLETIGHWQTGPLDDWMSSHGFVRATVSGDPNDMGLVRDIGVFSQPPWVLVDDPSTVPDDGVLVAIFSAPAEAQHVALRSRWKLDGQALYEVASTSRSRLRQRRASARSHPASACASCIPWRPSPATSSVPSRGTARSG